MKKIAIALLSMIYILIFFMLSEYIRILPEWVGIVLCGIFLLLCICLVVVDIILIENYAEITIKKSEKGSLYGIKKY